MQIVVGSCLTADWAIAGERICAKKPASRAIRGREECVFRIGLRTWRAILMPVCQEALSPRQEFRPGQRVGLGNDAVSSRTVVHSNAGAVKHRYGSRRYAVGHAQYT